MSDDKAIADIVNAPQQGAQRGSAEASDQNRDAALGRKAGGLLGNIAGLGGMGNLGSAASGLFGGHKKKEAANPVQDMLLEDGAMGKVAHGQSQVAGNVGLVVTPGQTSIALDLNRDGKAETIVTATTDGKLTVGNVEKGTHVTMNDPAGLASLITNSGQGAVAPGKNTIDFDGLAQEASSAMQLTPAATPKAPAPAHTPTAKHR